MHDSGRLGLLKDSAQLDPQQLTVDLSAIEQDSIYYLVILNTPDSDPNMNSRAEQLKCLQATGVTQIESCYSKVSKTRLNSTIQIVCPFLECLRTFSETGNLKTHMRIHVSIPL